MSTHNRRIKCKQLKFMVCIPATDWFEIIPRKREKKQNLLKGFIKLKLYGILHCILKGIYPFFSFIFRFHVQRKSR